MLLRYMMAANMDTFAFDIVTPVAVLASKHVAMAVVPGAEGEFGVLARHAPLIASLRPGVITLYEGDKVTERIFTAGGFVEVTPERCTVLATEAVNLKAVTQPQAKERLEKAEAALQRARDDVSMKKAAREVEVSQSLLSALS